MKKQVLLLCAFYCIIQNIQAQCSFHAIGHRGGASYYYPENTLLSIEQGFIEGAWAIEVDPRMTKDSVQMLMHDDYVDRTTNGHGFIAEMTMAQVKQLDAGSWKHPKFAGNRVPTLLEAIKIAQKYNRKLYLNMKVYEPKLIKKTLLESGASDTIFMIDPDDTTKVREYHALMPNTKLVYFGAPPSTISDASFYQKLKSQNVIAAEVPVYDILDSTNMWIATYRDMLHANGLEFWIYTINGHDLFQFAKKYGVDGLETDRAAMAKSFFCDGTYGGFFPEKRITGQWDFKTKNLDATIGSHMVFVGDSTVKKQKPIYGSTTDFSISKIQGEDANVVLIPGLDTAHALRFFSNIAPIGDSSWKYCDCNLDYTLIMDILKPASQNGFIALFQTGSANTDDAEMFIDSYDGNAIGVLDQYFGTMNDSVWYRLAFAFDLDNNKIKIYKDGEFTGTVSISDRNKYRFCINNNWAIQMSHLFSDESNETRPLFVNSVQLRDYTMTEVEIARLGKASASKIPTSIDIDSALCPSTVPILKDATVEEGKPFTISAATGDTLNYKWQYNAHNGVGWQDFVGSTFSQTANPSLQISSVSALYNGYGLRCSISNDCNVFTNEALLTVTPKKPIYSNITNTDTENIIFPNPNNGTFSINNNGTIQSISVFSTLGKLIKTIHYESEMNVELSLPAGLYYLSIVTTEQTKIQKLLIVH